MCGKFSYLATWAEVQDFSRPLVLRPSNAPEQLATPMREAPVLVLGDDRQRSARQMRWGFTTLRNERPFPEHIHAREDKLLSSRLWRPHFETRRGALIVNSFNEGEEVPTFKPDRVTPTGNTKTIQWTVRAKDGSRLAIAVIYREMGSGTPEFVMCTTMANKGVGSFVTGDPDKRMPAVLHEEDLPTWLGETDASLNDICDVLKPYEDEGAWEMTPQSSRNPAKHLRPEPPEQGQLF